MLDVDEGGQPAAFLRLGDDGEGEGRFAGRFRTVDLDDAAAGHATHAEGAVDEDVAGRDDVDIGLRMVAETHDGSVAVILGDLLQREVEVLVALGGRLVDGGFGFRFGGFGGHRVGWVRRRGCGR